MMDAVAVAENFNNAAAAVASAASAAAVLGHQPHSAAAGSNHSQQQSSPGGNSHSQTALANKNPFAIQELLGLGSNNDHQVGSTVAIALISCWLCQN